MFAWILLSVLLGSLLLFLHHRHFTYWRRRRISQLSPRFPFGDFGQFFRMQMCLGEAFSALYRSSRHLPFVGVYLSYRPALLVNDPELIKAVMVRDFEHFHDRGLHVNERKDPLSGHLFALGGEPWRHHRAKLTPTFTSGRLRGIFPNMVTIGRQLQEYVGRRVSEGRSELEIREIMARFTTQLIASVAFGIETDCINEEGNVFRRMGGKVFSSEVTTILRWATTFFTPKLKELLGFKFITQDVEDFLMGVVSDTLEYRERSGVVRKDMMQLLLQLRNTGTVSIDEGWDVEPTATHKKLSLEQVTAHAFVFFIAGYESSSTTISFCLYELAKNREIRQKAQREIDAVLSRHGGDITYESIAEMSYLERCIDETLRKYPALPFYNRECTKDYEIPGTNGVTIEKGTSVVIPAMGLHRDAEYFPDPDRFIPERSLVDAPYMPFGAGPRNCIGLRLGKIQVKLGLVAMLSRFEVALQAGDRLTEGELRLDARNIILFPKDLIRLVITERRDASGVDKEELESSGVMLWKI